MNNINDKFEEKVIDAIISNNRFNISKVLNLRNIKSTYFDSSEYSMIVDLIKEKNISGLQNLAPVKKDSFEFLDIYIFNDSANNEFVVTIYDSQELWQDPEVIDIILWS